MITSIWSMKEHALLRKLISDNAIGSGNSKSALITGSDGQDGKILTKKLIGQGYEVFGVTRRNLVQLLICLQSDGSQKILAEVNFGNITETNLILDSLRPDEIYHMAGVHSGSLTMRKLESSSFSQMEMVHVKFLENMINWMGKNSNSRLTCALSSQMYETLGKDRRVNSETEPNPIGPYGNSKFEAFKRIKEAQISGLKVFGAILFNHTSQNSKSGFLMQDIAKTIRQANSRNNSQLLVMNKLAKLDISDAEEVCEGIIALTRSAIPSSSVIGRGQLVTVEEIIREYFRIFVMREVAIISNAESQKSAVFADSREMSEKLGGWKVTKSPHQILADILASTNA